MNTDKRKSKKDHWEKLRKRLNKYCGKQWGSQTVLAEYLGVHRQQIERWVNGGPVPSYDTGRHIEE